MVNYTVHDLFLVHSLSRVYVVPDSGKLPKVSIFNRIEEKNYPMNMLGFYESGISFSEFSYSESRLMFVRTLQSMSTLVNVDEQMLLFAPFSPAACW